MHLLPPRLLLLALFAPVAFAQGPAKPDFPAGHTPNFPPKSRPEWRELRHESAKAEAAPAAAAARVRFSDPAQPATVRVVLPSAEIRIVGTDGEEVVVSSSLDPKSDAGAVDADGFRRLDQDVSFDLKEKDNVVTLALAGDMQMFGMGAEFELRVPRRANLVVRTQLGGDIAIAGVDGEIEVNGMNSEVTLTDIGSSAVVNTMNGDIVARFRQAPAKPVSISSMNGEIDLQIPAETKANVRLRTQHGTIRTNFPESALVTTAERGAGRGSAHHVVGAVAVAPQARAAAREAEQVARAAAEQARVAVAEQVRVTRNTARGAGAAAAPAAPEAPEPPLPPAVPLPPFGGRSVVGALNGGGVEIALSSMNGAITLRAGK
jgi:hypothetical protein